MRTRRKNVTFGKNKNDFALPLACLLLNALVIPGTGTLIYGEKQLGLSQFFLWLAGVILVLIGFPLLFLLIGFILIPVGFLLIVSAWIWALVTSIQFLIS